MGMGFQDDHGWPTLYWNIFSCSASRNTRRRCLVSRLSRRLEKRGYRPTPHTTDFERAWHRKTPDADFVLLLTGPDVCRVDQGRDLGDGAAPARPLACEPGS